MDPGPLVRNLRRGSGLTQDQLAIRAGTTTSAISRLERGHISPTVATLEAVLLCLGYCLELTPEPLEQATDGAQLEAVAPMSPTQRLDHGLASQRSLVGLIGAARD
jgi:transcriptional regulator with XRE-family HTH domain